MGLRIQAFTIKTHFNLLHHLFKIEEANKKIALRRKNCFLTNSKVILTMSELVTSRQKVAVGMLRLGKTKLMHSHYSYYCCCIGGQSEEKDFLVFSLNSLAFLPELWYVQNGFTHSCGNSTLLGTYKYGKQSLKRGSSEKWGRKTNMAVLFNPTSLVRSASWKEEEPLLTTWLSVLMLCYFTIPSTYMQCAINDPKYY